MRFSQFFLPVTPLLGLASAATLTFDILPAPNDVSCGSYSLVSTSYNGFTISPGAVLNTTQTGACHQSSGGSGPFGFAVSSPNLFASYGLTTFRSGSSFQMKEMQMGVNVHWTLLANHPELEVIVTATGKNAAGGVVKTEERVFGQNVLPRWGLTWTGYTGLRSFELLVEVRYMQDGVEQRGPWTVYVDNVEYKRR